MNGSFIKRTVSGVVLAGVVASLAAPAAAGFDSRTTRIEVLPPVHDLPVEPVYDVRHKVAEAGQNAVAPADTGSVGTALTAQHGFWEARSGMTVREVLTAWGEAAGWTVVWESDHTYYLQASARFDGSFVEASEALIASFERAVPPLSANYYGGNRVMVVESLTTGAHR